MHAVGTDGELVHDLCRDELGHGVHVRPSTQRAADEPRVLQRVARRQFGIVHEREVVHGDELGRAARRRHDEVRSVDDVDVSGPPRDRWPVDAAPQLSQRSGGDETLRHAGPGRNDVRELVAAAPRHGVGHHLDVGAQRHAGEHLAGKRADTGAPIEQRGDVKAEAHQRGILARPTRSGSFVPR